MSVALSEKGIENQARDNTDRRQGDTDDTAGREAAKEDQAACGMSMAGGDGNNGGHSRERVTDTVSNRN